MQNSKSLAKLVFLPDNRDNLFGRVRISLVKKEILQDENSTSLNSSSGNSTPLNSPLTRGVDPDLSGDGVCNSECYFNFLVPKP